MEAIKELLSGNWLLVAAGVVGLWAMLSTKGANPLVQGLSSIFMKATNTPKDKHDMDTDVGRFCAAKCLAEQFAKRGQTEVADAIRSKMHVLIDEGE